MSKELKAVLFICTGNYYRSRFAEALFNHLATERNLPWRAVSAGLQTTGNGNLGPLSFNARQAMVALDLEVDERMPRQADIGMLRAADMVIALSRAEHRPMIAGMFPGWEETVEYWKVEDLDVTEPHAAIEEIKRNVAKLIGELKRQAPPDKTLKPLQDER